MPKPQRHIVFNDTHFPFEDPVVWEMFLRFVSSFKPDRLHFLGDVMDFEYLSKFVVPAGRLDKLQDDYDHANRRLDELWYASEGCPVDTTEGNHDYRLPKLILNRFRQGSGLRCLRVPVELRFSERNMTWHKANKPYKVGSLWFSHGFIVRPHSAYSARGHMERVGGNIIVGHTHRFGTHYLTDWTRDIEAWENGCMQVLDPPYVTGKPNWQQGWAVVTFHERGLFQVEQIRVIRVKGQRPCYFWRGHRVTVKDKVPM